MTPKLPSFFDRIQYGAIAAFFGLLIGAAVALVVMGFDYAVLDQQTPYNTNIVWFSVVFYFAMGVIRGVDAGDTVGDGLAAIAGVLWGGIGVAGGGQIADGDFKCKRSMWWSVAYLLSIAFFASFT